ncbi:hypothetical protein [Novosphingobium album (ex Hu et al. 2023)]|uniref:Uncharacterized protein n=1 Tax=Novosphingobium album (ex Hu et al. 2023) TaxID=2930093 RepID=A0ABT0AZC3_9SPHN|nr:hypothetical protein [Novosphingobium album (ex Hu et al. 2023)]MCJ2178144.1 hypothetical protein [Novosphingobium album (ex Hu et al. 2023)]
MGQMPLPIYGPVLTPVVYENANLLLRRGLGQRFFQAATHIRQHGIFDTVLGIADGLQHGTTASGSRLPG